MRERSPTASAMFQGFRWLVRQSLRGVWWRGDPPAGPFVWAANHHSWWDPFIAAALLERWRRVGCLLLSQTNLERYRFIERLGGFGTGEYRRGLSYLRAGRVLIIFPEGELRPPGPLGRLAGGAGWFAHTAKVPLYAVATRVVVRGQQAPEAYLSLAQVAPPTGLASRDAARELTGRLTTTLTDELAALDAAVASADPRQPLPGFTRAVAGRRSWDERIDRVHRWLPWRPER
ncbi:1-acyl-sn-glycerol-3-phosphate acyltransferase [Natronosporangium hydrolyticum]|uniref:1-acyl-sn-glycerol-3-phosphate acyltransferase n=1 Tax=Natronosporangium hydrolyticum TaxID=2811111 RepID=A0A895Y7T9_9ACTN|nr:lysophospholipid acyltransferase family protein [Natronosporangium hydrolyticum]QSB13794.1 1-acyl-sn-glycerol-3-phosphate acyltransferase [Natronosporangium hydrolyticum]